MTQRGPHFSQQTGYQHTDYSAREDITTFSPHRKKNLSQSFPTHHILYSCHLARGVSSRKANTANKLIITTIATFIFINNSHPQTQSTRTSTTQIVAWPSQQTPSTSSAKLAKQDIDGIFSTRRNSFDWHTGRGWA